MTSRGDVSEDDESGLTILGALAQLRDDLGKLQEQNLQKGRAPLFLIEEGELELKLIVRRDNRAEGRGRLKFRLFVADVDAGGGKSGSNSTERLQTLRIKFKGIASKVAGEQKGVSFGSTAATTGTGREFETDPKKLPKGERR